MANVKDCLGRMLAKNGLPTRSRELLRQSLENGRMKEIIAGIEGAADPVAAVQAALDGITQENTATTAPAENALATETVSEDEKLWAAKNAQTDAQRKRLGLEPRMEPMKRGWGMVWDLAMQKIADAAKDGRNFAAEILTEFRASGRALDDLEVAVLTHELIIRETNYENLKASLKDAKTDTAKNEIGSQILQLQRDNDELFAAVQETGTITARALAMRQMMIDDRFNIVRMRSELIAANGGRPLTKEQSAEVEAAKEKMDAIKEKQSLKTASILDNQVAELVAGFVEALKQASANIPPEKKKSALKSMAEAARKRNAERLSQVGSGGILFNPLYYIDNTIIIADWLATGATKTLEGLKKFVQKEFGEEITEDQASKLKADADDIVASVGLTPAEKKTKAAKAKGKVAAEQDMEAAEGEGLPSKKLIYAAVQAKVQLGEKDPLKIMQAVHKDLLKDWPELTELQTKEIFSDYGKTSFPDQNELKRTMRDMRALVQQLAHIERMEKNLPLLKSGPQRDKASQQLREMRRRVGDMKKALGLNKKTDAQISSALDAAKTRLKNEIEDIEKYLKQPGGRTEAQKATKEGLKYDEEATALMKKRDELKGLLETLEGPKVLTFDQIVANTLKALEKTEEILTRKVETGDVAVKQKQGAPVLTPEIEEKLSYIQTLRESIQESRDALDPKKSKEQKALEQAQESLDYYLGILDGSVTPKTPSGVKAALSQAEEDVRLLIQSAQQVIREEKAAANRTPEDQRRIQAAEKELARLDRVMQGLEKPRFQKITAALTQREEDLKLEIAAMRQQIAVEAREAKAKPEAQKRLEDAQKELARLERVMAGTEAPRTAKGPTAALTQAEEDTRLEIAAMRKQLAEEKRAADKLAKGDPDGTLAKEKAKAAAYIRARDEYNKRVAAGNYMPAGKQPTQAAMSKETAAAYDEMQKAKQAYLDLRKTRQADIDLENDKKNTAKRIEKLKEKIAKGDFTKPSKKQRQMDDDLMKLQHKEWTVKREWLEGLFETKRANWNNWQKLGNAVGDFFGWARAWMTGLDLSALGRQAGFLLLARPGRVLAAVGPMMKAFKSEAYAVKHEFDLQNPETNPNALLYRRDGLELTSPFATSTLNKLEEEYRSRWISNPPKWLDILLKVSVAGHLIQMGTRASARAYTTMLNEVRSKSYDIMAATLTATGKPTEVEGKAIANMVNIWTGRGSIGSDKDKEGVFRTLTKIFFAPRYVASRFQTVFSPFYSTWQSIRGSFKESWRYETDKELARLRLLMASEYIRFIVGLGVVYTLYTLFQGSDDDDDKIEFDPRSSAFGKFKIGRSFVDPLAGLGQVVTLLARMGTWQGKNPQGQISERNAKEVLWYFGETKLSPIAGAVRNLLAKEDLRGNPVTVMGEAGRLLIPMSIRDIIETVQTQRGAGSIPVVIAAICGWSVQNYQEEQFESVDDADYNWLYTQAIALPKITLKQDLATIAGINPKYDESLKKDITEDQRKKLMELTLPEVNAAIKDLRQAFKDAPTDKDAWLEFRDEAQKEFNRRVKDIRQEHIWKAIE